MLITVVCQTDPDQCRITRINRGRTPAEVWQISGLIEVQHVDSTAPSRPLESLQLPRSALTTDGRSFSDPNNQL